MSETAPQTPESNIDAERQAALQAMLSNLEPLSSSLQGREQWRKISQNSRQLEATCNSDYIDF